MSVRSLPAGKKITTMAGLFVWALSPSFIDWEQSPEKRKQMIGFYAVGGILLYYGLLSG